MKILKKILASSLLLAGTFVWAGPWDSFLSNYDSTVAEINAGMDDFANQLSIAIPQAATQQNVWADAYIGKLLPSVPPHLGGGVNLGFTHINTAGLAKAASALNISGVQDSYYYPVFTAVSSRIPNTMSIRYKRQLLLSCVYRRPSHWRSFPSFRP